MQNKLEPKIKKFLDAIQEGKKDVVENMIKEEGVDVNTIHPGEGINNIYEGSSALQFAFINGQVEIANMLIEYGADINYKYKNNNSILHYACTNGLKELAIKILKEGKIPIDDLDSYKNTPLFYAVVGRKFDMVRFLISKGADVYHKNRFGNTVIYKATSPEILNYLLRNYDLNANGDEEYKSPLGSYAIRAGEKNRKESYKKQGEILIKFGANVKKLVGQPPNTILFRAASGNDIGFVKLILDCGFDINTEEGYHGTALYEACGDGFVEMVKLLIKRGADVNKLSTSGEHTPLHRAVRNNRKDIIKILLEAGANPKIRNKNGELPIEQTDDKTVQKLIPVDEEMQKLLDNKFKNAENVINKLIDMNYFTLVQGEQKKEAIEKIKSGIVRHGWFEPGYRYKDERFSMRSYDMRWYHADAENLAERGVVEFIEKVNHTLKLIGAQIDNIEEVETDDDSYKVKINDEVFEIYSSKEAKDSWTLATKRTLEILNKSLEKASKHERAFGRKYGNDVEIAILTDEIVEFLNKNFGKENFSKIYRSIDL